MKYSLIMSDKVMRQIDDIADYILRESGDIDTAMGVVERLDEAVQKLCYMPYKGSVSRDIMISKQGCRVLVVDPYLVFYRCDDDKKEVTVVAVVHSRRDYTNLLF